ncbi:hypothetical protein FHX05_005372 [Rhizobium sp. BK491]|nr:hypothetical protein [Rhizobium sp. BK491]
MAARPRDSACGLSSRRNRPGKADQVSAPPHSAPMLGIPYNQNPDSCQGLRSKLIDRQHDICCLPTRRLTQGRSFHTASHVRLLENPDSCQGFVVSAKTGESFSEAATNDFEVPSTLENFTSYRYRHLFPRCNLPGAQQDLQMEWTILSAPSFSPIKGGRLMLTGSHTAFALGAG